MKKVATMGKVVLPDIMLVAENLDDPVTTIMTRKRELVTVREGTDRGSGGGTGVARDPRTRAGRNRI